MSLIYAEGFEHFHESSENISGGRFCHNFATWVAPVYSLISARPDAILDHNIWPNNSAIRSRNPDDRQFVASQLNPHKIVTSHPPRKGGRCLRGDIPRQIFDGYSSNRPGSFAIGFGIPKSRTVFVGFALRTLAYNDMLTLQVAFGRTFARPTCPQGHTTAFHRNTCQVVARLVIRERAEGMCDLQWVFPGQPSVFGQVYVGTEHFPPPPDPNAPFPTLLRSGDWNHFEAGLSVAGNVSSSPSAWCESVIRGKRDRHENILTSAPDTSDSNFINYIAIIPMLEQLGPINSSPYNFLLDDIYVCNDEGSSNNTFLGNVYVRSMLPTHEGLRSESTVHGATSRHEAVGPHFVGTESSLPSPLPSPETDPNFVPWGPNNTSRISLLRQGHSQTFRFSGINFSESEPCIHGVVASAIANVRDPLLGRPQLLPMRTVGGVSDEFFLATSPPLGSSPSVRVLSYNNPFAGLPLHAQEPYWRANFVANAEYGFRISAPGDAVAIEEEFNPLVLRRPLVFECFAIDYFFASDDPNRFFEFSVSDTFETEAGSRWDWACVAQDVLYVFDESLRVRVSPLWTWSNLVARDELPMPSEFIRDQLSFFSSTQFDWHSFMESSLAPYDTSYHEHVEQVQSWFDPYDHSAFAAILVAEDYVELCVSDVFDNHFFVDDDLAATSLARSNHLLAEEYLGFASEATNGYGITVESGFCLTGHHHDGNWVEQFEEWIGVNSSVLTRHWRFEIFMLVCVGWWEIGPVEQPLTIDEPNPCAQYNLERVEENYKQFIGYEADAVRIAGEMIWLEAEGDPKKLELEEIRWTDAYMLMFDPTTQKAEDWLDYEGVSIFGEK